MRGALSCIRLRRRLATLTFRDGTTFLDARPTVRSTGLHRRARSRRLGAQTIPLLNNPLPLRPPPVRQKPYDKTAARTELLFLLNSPPFLLSAKVLCQIENISSNPSLLTLWSRLWFSTLLTRPTGFCSFEMAFPRKAIPIKFKKKNYFPVLSRHWRSAAYDTDKFSVSENLKQLARNVQKTTSSTYYCSNLFSKADVLPVENSVVREGGRALEASFPQVGISVPVRER